ncbi:MAG: hypothetical protein E6Q89_02075 [Bacteroidia bacterium]|nr:MAG: hypothetical protein E6Q89_02075 [Bacteroidia bacterium]
MMEKKEYITQLAKFLVATNTTMTGETLADLLNWNKFKTNYNSEYEGGRGTYTLIHATYDWLVAHENQEDADKVALAFKKPDGTYAYNK